MPDEKLAYDNIISSLTRVASPDQKFWTRWKRLHSHWTHIPWRL